MALDDRNKLNRLEELKGKLFSKDYRTKIEHRDSFSHLNKKEIMESWDEEEKVETNDEEKFFMKTSRFKKFFIFSLGFFVLTLGYAGYVFFAGGNTVSNNNIDVSITGNNFTAGGEELALVVGITNRNSASLDLVDLIMEYPKGSADGLSSDTAYFRESLGTIPAGAVRNENLKVVLFGEQGTARKIKISLEYRVSGSNAIFIKETFYDVTISSTPINLSVDAPLSISPNQDINLKVKTTLNATKPAENMLVRMNYPVGFQFVSSTPEPAFGNNVWNLGDLAPGAEREITITGKMIDVFDGEEKTFSTTTGSQSEKDKSTIGVVFNSVKNTLTVKKPFIEANLFINGVLEREYAIDSKTSVSGEIRFVNNSEAKVTDLEIEAKISGNAFNRNTVDASQGYYDSSKHTILWDKNSKNQFRELSPGDSGSVNFSVATLPLYSASGGLMAEPTVKIEVSIRGKQSIEGFATSELENSTGATVRVISDVGFTPKILYYSGVFKNTGPIPPKADNLTTYTVSWNLSSTANNISKAQVTSTLPPWVTYVGVFSPTNEKLTYNASTKTIVWNADKITKGAGITGTPRSVSFQISLKPSLSQVGNAPIIINDAVLTGHDDFANVDVRVREQGLTTRVENESMFPSSGGNVVE